jgi:hypothetical protein
MNSDNKPTSFARFLGFSQLGLAMFFHYDL